jgi:hypothetical protein
MVFDGVELLKLQFSRAVDLAFERFLDSWSLGVGEEGVATSGSSDADEVPADVPLNLSA